MCGRHGCPYTCAWLTYNEPYREGLLLDTGTVAFEEASAKVEVGTNELENFRELRTGLVARAVTVVLTQLVLRNVSIL